MILLIMAAGIGSRFGKGIKQLDPVGPNGEIIMDYSIHDAIECGFNKVVIVIRRDIEKEFREVIGERLERSCKELGVELHYAFQDSKDIPEGYEVPVNRTKPWGTGQAVLAAKKYLTEPFCVINADDYYGKKAFVAVHDELKKYSSDADELKLSLAGFILKNTLSNNGTVTRGLCQVDENGMLQSIVETKEIKKTAIGAAVGDKALDPETHVSMNMWGLTPEFVGTLSEGFKEFFEKDVPANPEKAEYLLPIFIGELLEEKAVTVHVLPTTDHWFGMTYQEDVPVVREEFRKLLSAGVYKSDLMSDLK